MILPQTTKSVLNNFDDTEGTEFSISEKHLPKLINLLTSDLYKNKPGAVVRELSTNCLDAHKMINNDEPFTIILPSKYNNNILTIRDYGPGLNKDQIFNLYTKYLESTKENTNDFTGCLGLGSKSPFSISSNFTVTSFNEDLITTYLLSEGSNKIPRVDLISEVNINDIKIKDSNNKNIKDTIIFDSDFTNYNWYKSFLQIKVLQSGKLRCGLKLSSYLQTIAAVEYSDDESLKNFLVNNYIDLEIYLPKENIKNLKFLRKKTDSQILIDKFIIELDNKLIDIKYIDQSELNNFEKNYYNNGYIYFELNLKTIFPEFNFDEFNYYSIISNQYNLENEAVIKKDLDDKNYIYKKICNDLHYKTGLRIDIPIKDQYIDNIISEVGKQLYFFPIKPNVFNYTNYGISLEETLHFSNILKLNLNNTVSFKLDDNKKETLYLLEYITNNTSMGYNYFVNNFSKYLLVQGGVNYTLEIELVLQTIKSAIRDPRLKIDKDFFPIFELLIKDLNNNNTKIVLEVDIGTVNFNPSREMLNYDLTTCLKIYNSFKIFYEKKFSELKNELSIFSEDEINSVNNIIQNKDINLSQNLLNLFLVSINYKYMEYNKLIPLKEIFKESIFFMLYFKNNLIDHTSQVFEKEPINYFLFLRNIFKLNFALEKTSTKLFIPQIDKNGKTIANNYYNYIDTVSTSGNYILRKKELNHYFFSKQNYLNTTLIFTYSKKITKKMIIDHIKTIIFNIRDRIKKEFKLNKYIYKNPGKIFKDENDIDDYFKKILDNRYNIIFIDEKSINQEYLENTNKSLNENLKLLFGEHNFTPTISKYFNFDDEYKVLDIKIEKTQTEKKQVFNGIGYIINKKISLRANKFQSFIDDHTKEISVILKKEKRITRTIRKISKKEIEEDSILLDLNKKVEKIESLHDIEILIKRKEAILIPFDNKNKKLLLMESGFFRYKFDYHNDFTHENHYKYLLEFLSNRPVDFLKIIQLINPTKKIILLKNTYLDKIPFFNENNFLTYKSLKESINNGAKIFRNHTSTNISSNHTFFNIYRSDLKIDKFITKDNKIIYDKYIEAFKTNNLQFLQNIRYFEYIYDKKDKVKFDDEILHGFLKLYHSINLFEKIKSIQFDIIIDKSLNIKPSILYKSNLINIHSVDFIKDYIKEYQLNINEINIQLFDEPSKFNLDTSIKFINYNLMKFYYEAVLKNKTINNIKKDILIKNLLKKLEINNLDKSIDVFTYFINPNYTSIENKALRDLLDNSDLYYYFNNISEFRNSLEKYYYSKTKLKKIFKSLNKSFHKKYSFNKLQEMEKIDSVSLKTIN